MGQSIPVTPAEAARLQAYWSGFTNRDPHSGLLVNGLNDLNDLKLRGGAGNGALYNIYADTEVKAYRPLRSKDCIPTESLPVLDHHRLLSDARARQMMAASLIQAPGPVWDQNTSRKLRWVDPRLVRV
jgi:hypothetical protein